MEKVIRKKNPLRVDLAGGTLDCWPLYVYFSEPITLNFSLPHYTEVVMRVRPEGDSSIHVWQREGKLRESFANLGDYLKTLRPEFPLVQSVLHAFRPQFGVDIELFSQSPPGGGLAASSSLCVGLVNAFSELFNRDMEFDDKVRLSANIEARALGKPAGTQDYFPALKKGFHHIHYTMLGPKTEVFEIPDFFSPDRYLVVFSGDSHHSGISNWQVIRDFMDSQSRMRLVLNDLSAIAREMSVRFKEARLDDIHRLFETEYVLRKNLSQYFVTQNIEEIVKLGQSNGLVAKVCGAGGGGCVWLWNPYDDNQKLERVRLALLERDIQVVSCE